MLGHPGLDVRKAQLLQPVSHQLGGAHLLIRQLRMHVDVPPDLHQLWKHLLNALLKNLVPGFSGTERGGKEKQEKIFHISQTS